jgi:hypothetical protein
VREIRKPGSMSGERKRSVAVWPKLPRLFSTLPQAEIKLSRCIDVYDMTTLHACKRPKAAHLGHLRQRPLLGAERLYAPNRQKCGSAHLLDAYRHLKILILCEIERAQGRAD